MKRERRIPKLCLMIAWVGTIGCQAAPVSKPKSPTGMLAEWMSGSFSSAAQAADDPENYFDIRLEMVPIWSERSDGPWLYVEQAAASALDRPYRQRVYHLVETEDGGTQRRVRVAGRSAGLRGCVDDARALRRDRTGGPFRAQRVLDLPVPHGRGLPWVDGRRSLPEQPARSELRDVGGHRDARQGHELGPRLRRATRAGLGRRARPVRVPEGPLKPLQGVSGPFPEESAKSVADPIGVVRHGK